MYGATVARTFGELQRPLKTIPTHTHMQCMHLLFPLSSFGCQRDPHEPITCDFLTKWLKKCDDEGETANWLHINTKVGVAGGVPCGLGPVSGPLSRPPPGVS